MENSGDHSLSAGQASLAGRYASALFGLARDEKQIDSVSKSLESLSQALAESADLKRLVSSPLVTRADAGKVIATIAPTLGLDKLTANFIGVLAHNGRLRELPKVIAAIRALAAAHRGETTAQVTSAHPLDDDQVAALRAQLKARAGRDVAIERIVDPAILGGIIVRLGSQMIDASIRTRLNTLAQAMRG
ncbi:F0F1 ATP synthase subunit delta [Sphingomonas sp.]|uniref:F0F1 ATP synthase subunit delta n=1 Tax=Sphingomonas sp. TaxID=28214 RepID=UPI0037504597